MPNWLTLELVITIILALAGIAVSIFLAVRLRARKEISFDLSPPIPVLSVEQAIRGRVQVLFDGEQVQDVRALAINVRNSGNQPIRVEDYQRALSFDFGESTSILSAEVVGEQTDSHAGPSPIGATITVDNSKVALDPVLLNSGDRLSLFCLLENYNDVCTPGGRIVGEAIRRKSERQTLTSDMLRYIAAVLVTLTAVTVTLLDSVVSSLGVSDRVTNYAFLTVAAAAAVLAAIQYFIRERPVDN